MAKKRKQRDGSRDRERAQPAADTPAEQGQPVVEVGPAASVARDVTPAAEVTVVTSADVKDDSTREDAAKGGKDKKKKDKKVCALWCAPCVRCLLRSGIGRTVTCWVYMRGRTRKTRRKRRTTRKMTRKKKMTRRISAASGVGVHDPASVTPSIS